MSQQHDIIPPPLGLIRPSRSNVKYKLTVIQNPIRARCCGFGEKDRRLIDPPPIVQLTASVDGVDLELTPADAKLFVVHCSLYSADTKEERNLVSQPYKSLSQINDYKLSNIKKEDTPYHHYDQQQRIPQNQPPVAATNDSHDSSYSSSSSGNFSSSTLSNHSHNSNNNNKSVSVGSPEPPAVRNLIGSVVSSAYCLYNLENEKGVYSVFNDLSVRTEGTYTLRFLFFDLAAGEPMTMSTRVQAETFSEPFVVYTPKNFQGMTATTELSKCFSRQGVKIITRKNQQHKMHNL